MSDVLNADQRRHLDASVQRARVAAERAAADALHALAVAEPTRPAYLSQDDNALRLALREKARQLGDDTARSGAQLTNLVREVAYEQWHRLMFARFLEVNGLLRHPEFRDTSLTLEDCSDLADDLSEPDGWSVAALFASEILPGVFRLDDPTVQVRFAAEHRLELERILLAIPTDVFVTEDALGWVYQFWQTAEKKRVNESGVKIGGADLSPVTQLFTENYMVRFLLENSLGAWWAARHPESPLIGSWKYLRRLDDGTPAAGTFPEWPTTAAEVTVMDPCCGSGHFLVEAFSMLWQMRAEEEDVSSVDAQDAVLRDNLFGLELDPRCVQIAMFAVALQAWKVGRGWRSLPTPNIACSGIPVKAPVHEWKRLASDDVRLESALVRLHSLFRDADTLGSLIDPKRIAEMIDPAHLQQSLEDVEWGDVAPLLTLAASAEERDPSTVSLGTEVRDLVRSASLLSGSYTLVCTNVPYLGRTGQGHVLREYLTSRYPNAAEDLATAFACRLADMTSAGGSVAQVLPESALFLGSLTAFRRKTLTDSSVDLLALLGPGAFEGIGGEVVRVALIVLNRRGPQRDQRVFMLDASRERLAAKPEALSGRLPLSEVKQSSLLKDRSCRMVPGIDPEAELLSRHASSIEGMSTGDGARYQRNFWELGEVDPKWILFQRAPAETAAYGGLDTVVLWENGQGALASDPGARIQGLQAWGGAGILVERMSSLRAAIYMGGAFQKSTVVVRPFDPSILPAIWRYCESGEHKQAVLAFERRIGIATSAIVDVPFDVDRWRDAAEEEDPLQEPWSADPTQWLFQGRPDVSTSPLQVAVARLLGYHWPDQQSDDLDQLVDADGIAALQALPGEPDLVTRLRELLVTAYADRWSNATERTLVTEAGGRNGRLEDWLRDSFFAQHVKVFDNRPFLWHIWDGRKDGFSAIVNYHRLDHRTLEKLTFTVLGAWIERQKYEADAGRAGADMRLAAALDLQGRLKLILDGAPPYDVYVRWKDMSEQQIGWDPDFDDGVRLNIRPFVTAEVLRSRVNVHWKKDRGTDPDGAERINDLHPTLEERRAARQRAGAGGKGSR